MTLIPLELPAGLYRNGTDLQSAGRWRDASLVRWQDGSLRPIGGWVYRKQSAFAYAPRALLAWRDLSGNRDLAAGTYEKLYHVSASGTVSDITPAGFTSGLLDAAVNTGFGGGFFGVGFYGTPRADSGTYSEATTWSLDNWGENLVACSSADGKLYEWTLNVANPAVAIANAPTSCKGLVVTPERFLMALGAGGNPRKLQWSDREDNTTWTAAATNEAGDIELQTSGQIMQGINTRGQTLILTDQDAHTATFQGGLYVYAVERVGTSCGALSRRAAASTESGIFWMGQRGFFNYAGGAVQEIPCDVSDYVFGDISTSQASKVYGVANAQFGEVWWFYPSADSTECNRYVMYDYKQNYWTFGVLSRSAGIDRGVFNTPIFTDTSGNLYNHETGLNYDGGSVYAESGPFALGAGDSVMCVTDLIPDEETQGDVTLTFKTRFHPNDTERDYGPYTPSNPTSVRFTGRQVRMKVEGANLSDWRFGIPRLDAVPGGRR